MGASAFVEPLVNAVILFGGAYINRNKSYKFHWRSPPYDQRRRFEDDHNDETGDRSPASVDGLLDDPEISTSPSRSFHAPQYSTWRRREIRILRWKREVTTPNTKIFEERFLSRVLQKLPFLVEVWYCLLIFWVYQFGRAVIALTLDERTVSVARDHALQVIRLEEKLNIFVELPIQRWFLQRPLLMLWTNRIYSFIHIPGSVLFLAWLYHYTITFSNRLDFSSLYTHTTKTAPNPTGLDLYETRRRTLAMSNLLAFIIFTSWPLMPPRLLSTSSSTSSSSHTPPTTYPFTDTVHTPLNPETSLWTHNKYTNPYAAMPSLHFGYSLLIGLSIALLPLSPSRSHRHRSSHFSLRSWRINIHYPSLRRMLCVSVGVAYPAVICLAIVATANHFVLDAVAGAGVCLVAWYTNGVLKNLAVLEDWVNWGLRIHKPERQMGEGWRGFKMAQ